MFAGAGRLWVPIIHISGPVGAYDLDDTQTGLQPELLKHQISILDAQNVQEAEIRAAEVDFTGIKSS